MKLKKYSGVEIESSTDIDEEQDITMSSRKVGHIMRALSSTLYQDKAGSMVREMVSNAWDAHKEIKSDKAVIVEVTNNQLVIKDEGPGFSEERMKNVFASFGESTKNNSNDEHGGFGMGSKTPLAYTTDFTLRTWVNGIRYVYLIHLSNNLPKVKRLEKTPDHEHCNGTEVIIGIKSGDYYTIQKAIKRQLLYFDNLVVFGVAEWDNEYRLIRGKNFIINSKFPPAESNICLGQVAYPLRRDLVEEAVKKLIANGKIIVKGYNTPNSSMVASFMGIRLGLKFEIGDLPVVLSRESIEYDSSETEQKIIQKVYDVFLELEELYLAQPITELDFVDELQRKTELTLNLSGHDISLTNFAHLSIRRHPKYQDYNFSKIQSLLGTMGLMFKYELRVSANGAGSKSTSYWNNSYAIITVNDLLRVYNTRKSLDNVYIIEDGEKLVRKKAHYIAEKTNSVVTILRYTGNTLSKEETPDNWLLMNKIIPLLEKDFEARGIKKFSDIVVPDGWGKVTNTGKMDVTTTIYVYNDRLTKSISLKEFLNDLSSQHNGPYLLLPYAAKEEFIPIAGSLGISVAFCKASIYAELLNKCKTTLMDITTYCKKHRRFREELTLYKINRIYKAKQIAIHREIINWGLSEILEYLPKSEQETAQKVVGLLSWKHDEKSAIIDSLLDYIDSNPKFRNFYRQDWIKIVEKVLSLSEMSYIEQLKDLDKSLAAKVYLKIIKDRRANEFIKKYLLYKDRTK